MGIMVTKWYVLAQRMGILLGLFCACALQTGCFPLPDAKPKTDAASADDSGDTGDTAEEASKPKRKPRPKEPGQAFSLRLKDGLRLAGRLYEPDSAAKAPYPVIILLHSVEGSRHDWGRIPLALTREGWAALALDLRGHGDSTQLGGNRTLSRLMFQDADWLRLPADVQAVVLCLQQPAKLPGHPPLDPRRILLMGTGLGSVVSVMAAGPTGRDLPKPLSEALSRVQGLVLWAPRSAAKGMDTTLPMLHVSCPILIAGDPRDPLSTDAIGNLAHLAKTPVTVIRKNNGPIMQGDLLFNWPEGLKQTIQWVHQRV